MVHALGPDAVATGSSLVPSAPQMRLGQIWAQAKTQPTIWHAHRINELIVGLGLRLFSPGNVRVVFTRHAATKASGWTRFWARQADLVIALTAEGRENLQLPQAEIIGHGVDLSTFTPPASRAETWAALDLGGQYGIGVVGRIRPNKGQGDFVEAITPLLPAFTEWKSVLVGQARPSDRAWLEGLQGRTQGALAVIDEQPNIVPWYQGLSVLVQPSHSEGFSLVVLEAMASGCCVIAARLPHFPDLIEHGTSGLLYEPGDLAALRALLAQVMQHPDQAARMGHAARARIAAHFGVEREAAALRTQYERLLQTKR